MKRILLTIILVMELVIGGVLYFSFSALLDTPEQREPGQIQEPRPLVEQQVQTSTFIEAQSRLTETSGESDVSRQRGQISTQQSPSKSLVLSSAVLRYFDELPPSAHADNGILTDELTSLGRMLFYDQRLSVNGTISCNTCHLLDAYGVDHRALSLGFDGQPVKRNSPTVYNAALHIGQFWDGRSQTVEEQAKEPILSFLEMGFESDTNVEEVIRAIPGYWPYFEAAFPGQAEPITFDNISIAIGAFERKLITPSRFDQFLAGQWNAFTPEEFRGLGTFVEIGCTDCHQGSVVGGQLYKKIGIVEPYPTEDQGRYEVTRAESDRYVFKVPSLRNVAETAPYLHDGSITTLPEMVELMARYQLGKTLDTQQLNDIISFLNALTGEIPHSYIERPLLP